MRIKNVKLLRARARWHAKEGHVKQGTYGGGRVNGEVEFHGCFVGCLATPHSKRALKSFLQENLSGLVWASGESHLLERTVREQHRTLTATFGLTPPLIALIEAFFEAQPTHAEAIDFVPKVAAALNEGADISPKDVRLWWRERHPSSIYAPHRAGSYTNLQRDIRGPLCMTPREQNRRVRIATEEFLKFLSEQKPAQTERTS
jgi:hypothetical protein